MQQVNAKDSNSLRRTKTLLACGVASGPLFYIVAVAQMFTRSGFDIRHHAISLLAQCYVRYHGPQSKKLMSS